MSWKDFPLAVKLGIGFGLLIALTVTIGLLANSGINGIIKNANEVIISRQLQQEMTQKIVDHLRWSDLLTDYLYNDTYSVLEAETDHTHCALGTWYFGEDRKEVEARIPGLIPLLKSLEQPHRELHKSATTIKQQTKVEGIKTYNTQTIKNLKEVQDILENIRQTTATSLISDEKMLSQGAATRMFSFLFIGIALVLGIVITIIITGGITKALRESMLFTRTVARGDLSCQLNEHRKDEVGLLAQEIDAMAEKLREITGSVNNAAENVSIGSSQLSTSSNQLSSGASEQASTATEVTTRVDHLFTKVNQNVEKAVQTAKISSQSAEKALKGKGSVDETIKGIVETAEKIRLIDDVARETNMLAINAAMEAARAGEAGLGFKAVAERTGVLAKKSREVSLEIDTLSKRNVDLAKNAGLMFEGILPDIKQVAELTAVIKESAIDQSHSLEEVSRSIASLNEIIQDNASTSEEIASMAEELSGQSDILRRSCSYFKSK